MTVQHDALIKVFSYYRDAEMRGASLLIKMMARIKDPEAQVLFSRHIHDETRHAWLWTKRIKDEGSLPVEVPDGYQRRLGKALGIPTSILDLFALTVIVEERAHKRYAEHAASPLCDDKTLAVLSDVTKDEKWHVAWMEDYLVTLAKGPRAEDFVSLAVSSCDFVIKTLVAPIANDQIRMTNAQSQSTLGATNH